MTPVVVFFVATFAVAGAVGLVLYRSSVWHYIDIVYYPLAAVGVALLFANNSTQRREFELDQQANKRRVALQAILSAKPAVGEMTSEDLLNASFGLVATISEIAAVCKKVPMVDPQCMVAEKLQPSIDVFLDAARDDYLSPELKLSAACTAAEHLLDDIRSNERMSSLTGEELIAQYKAAVGQNYNLLAYESVNAEAESFEHRALAKVEWLRNAVAADDSASMKLVLDMRTSEVAFGKTILHGLFPCIVAPRKDLELLAKWTLSRHTEEQALNQLERDRQQVKQSSATDPATRWLYLNLWPFVLIGALSLKFAKGVAAVRKADSRITESVPASIKEERPAEEDAPPIQSGADSEPPQVDLNDPETPNAGDPKSHNPDAQQ